MTNNLTSCEIRLVILFLSTESMSAAEIHREISCEFPQISSTVLYVIITVRLDYYKFCARWIPKILTGAHKTQRISSALTLLKRYHKDGDEFHSHIVRVIAYGTWVSFLNVGNKEHSKQWIGTHSQNKPKKFKQTLSVCKKADGNCFLGQERLLMMEFMQQGTTIMSEVHCETLINQTA
jgi:hypothetical protein